jgi:hypothetical protein
VVLHQNARDVRGLNVQSALVVYLNTAQARLLSLAVLLVPLKVRAGIAHVVLNLIELTIIVVNLVFNSQEHHSPGQDGVVVVPLTNASRQFVPVFLACKEIKVR